MWASRCSLTRAVSKTNGGSTLGLKKHNQTMFSWRKPCLIVMTKTRSTGSHSTHLILWTISSSWTSPASRVTLSMPSLCTRTTTPGSARKDCAHPKAVSGSLSTSTFIPASTTETRKKNLRMQSKFYGRTKRPSDPLFKYLKASRNDITVNSDEMMGFTKENMSNHAFDKAKAKWSGK